MRTLTWLKVKEAARLLDLTDSAIKKAIKKNKYDKKSEKGIDAYLCEECGHIDLWLQSYAQKK